MAGSEGIPGEYMDETLMSDIFLSVRERNGDVNYIAQLREYDGENKGEKRNIRRDKR